MSERSNLPTDHMRITHIGGPTALMEIGSLRLLTDPTFEPAGYRYPPDSPNALVKTADPAIAAAEIGPIDAVLLSHDHHADNLDTAGRQVLGQARETLTTPSGAERLGGNARGMATWETVTLTGSDGLIVRLTATPARHGPAAVKHLTGDVTGFVLEWDGQRRGALYISGDTVLFEGVEEVARRYRVGVALLHCGAARSQRLGPDPLTLTGAEAAQLAQMLPDATIIPIHHEGWAHFSEGRDAIERAFAGSPAESRLRFLPLGQSVALDM
ncbi:MAG TPA: MBL fold metallo-hydrolase [Ktedonobacterales bacterium]